MRLIVTILSGVRAGYRIVIGSGETLSVGRTSKAEIIVADDQTMSGSHFELQCEGGKASVRDLNSRNGLFINGRHIEKSELTNGDQLRAGRTSFAVAVEKDASDYSGDETVNAAAFEDATLPVSPPVTTTRGGAPPWRGATMVFSSPSDNSSAANFADSTLQCVSAPSNRLRALWPAAPERLYAVVDGSIALTLVNQAKHLGLRTECLIPGLQSPYLAAVAPYLIELSLESGFLDLWDGELQYQPGVLLTSKAEFEEMLAHARRIFIKRDAAGKESFFRFYDSKVLRAWLADARISEAAEFFGCISAIVVGSESGTSLSRFSLKNSTIDSHEISMA